ncbi:MAG: peptidoglycan DD-metalloendopeptidase family protein [Anaerolineaceae bacterium]|nr:peptidoglycan DD-metalloendopeptidase family protein [Anaerolineaceae bacterium]
MRRVKYLLVMFIIAACQPTAPAATPFAATIPPAQGAAVSAAQVVTAVPTANPLPSRTPTLPPTATFTPSRTPTNTSTPTPTLTPTDTLTPTNTLSPTPVPTSTPIASPTPTNPADDPNNTPAPTWTPPPADPSVQIADHYMLRRPIADGGANWVARTYAYGSNSGGLQVHHGVDMVNPTGTPVMAAADGAVIYAGSDTSALFGPQNNYYGNVVVIQHNFSSPEGLPVYTLYGHLDRVDVQTGQQVKQGDRIGVVGGTGVAFGPHLHFEVRLGDPNSFSATRNPELWIYPYRGYGTLAGRVTDANGTVLYNAPIQVKSADLIRYPTSYADNSVNPDQTFGESFVLGDLPADYYEVSVTEGGRVRFRKLIYVYPNRTTWIDITLN